MSGHHRQAPSPELRRHWRLIRGLLVTLLGGLCIGGWWLVTAAGAPSKPPAKSSGMAAHWPPLGATSAPTATTAAPVPPPSTTSAASGLIALTGSGPGWLAPGSDPAAVPGPVLISDGGGNRVLIVDPDGRTVWQFPRAGDLAAGQSFKAPEVAWFTPDNKQIVVAAEDDHSLEVIDIATHKIIYTYGSPGTFGSAANQVNRPDGVVMLATRELVVPDAGNCRIIRIAVGAHAVSSQLGQTGNCVHHPPQTFNDPSGLFPMANGNYLVTEGKDHWVSEMSLAGKVAWSVQVPGVKAIYQTAEVAPDRYLTVDHVVSGQVLTFDHTGKVLWRYAPTGSASLNKPSLAIPLPNGYYMVSDKVNNRVIVVNPTTNSVVWQYGHTGVPGAGYGFLNNPTGMDLYPPNSLAAKHPAK